MDETLAAAPGRASMIDRPHESPGATPASRETNPQPHPTLSERMHPMTLRFAAPVEAEFAGEYFESTLTQVRMAFVLALLLYSIFGALDLLIAPGQVRALWTIRFAVAVPVLTACLAFSYNPLFRRARDQIAGAAILVATLGIVAMTAIIPAPGNYLYYAGINLGVIFVFTLVRLSVPYSAAISAITIVAYVCVAVWISRTTWELIVNNLFFLISTFVIGLLANYSMERYARSNFLQRRVIARRTQELERKNSELVVKNRLLAEARAATIRTERRSELIYSALSEALPGTVLDDKYRIEERIGSGAFGTVYRGEHIFLHHPVAIKVFRPVVGREGLESLDRFRLEGISACRINHPNAVTVLDFDVSLGSLAYLVMELLEGRSLADEMRTGARMDPERCVQIALAVCDALAEAHAAGIVHRDIKPSNVFLHRNRTEQLVKVIDFGIAKLTDAADPMGPQQPTIEGTFVGTPAYMAPERLIGDPYDGRADVYGVGVMMYEMLSGRIPFDDGGEGIIPVLRKRVTDDPPGLRSIVPRIRPELAELVERAVARLPDERPTAAELAAALRTLISGGPPGAADPASPRKTERFTT